jgi:hypothetical protein
VVRCCVRDGPGKLLSLLDLIAEHEQAFAYDWRVRFSVPLEVVFDGRMAWHESWDLSRALIADPSSQVYAAVAGWPSPMGRTEQIAADLFDLTAAIAAGKRTPKPYPRPWHERPEKYGSAGGRTPDEVKAILAVRRGNPAVRDARGRLHDPTTGRFVKG